MTPLRCVEAADISRVVLQGRPELRRGSQDVLESLRHHAEDGIKVVVERDLAPYDGAVAAETPPPQRVAEDHHMGTFETIVGFLEVPSERRRDAQRTEVPRAPGR